jgi:hypothetical protein
MRAAFVLAAAVLAVGLPAVVTAVHDALVPGVPVPVEPDVSVRLMARPERVLWQGNVSTDVVGGVCVPRVAALTVPANATLVITDFIYVSLSNAHVPVPGRLRRRPTGGAWG